MFYIKKIILAIFIILSFSLVKKILPDKDGLAILLILITDFLCISGLLSKLYVLVKQEIKKKGINLEVGKQRLILFVLFLTGLFLIAEIHLWPSFSSDLNPGILVFILYLLLVFLFRLSFRVHALLTVIFIILTAFFRTAKFVQTAETMAVITYFLLIASIIGQLLFLRKITHV